MADQLAFDGVEPGEPRKKRKRATKAGDKPPRRWGPSFYGATVPEPKDALGQVLAMGPYQVLQTTRSQMFVFDRRRPLGQGTVFEGGLRACVVWMVRQAKSSTGPATSRSG